MFFGLGMAQLVIRTTLFSGFSFTHPFGVRERAWLSVVRRGEGVKKNKNALYLSVNVFSTKVLIGDTLLTSPTGDETAILHGHPSQAKV